MSADQTVDQTLSLTPDQKSDIEAASEQVYADGADEMIGQSTGLDVAALLTLGVIVIMVHVLSTDLRTASQLGSAFRSDSLRKVITVMLGFLSVSLYVGERQTKRRQDSQNNVGRIVAGVLLGVYTLYVASYTFLGLELATDSLVVAVAEYAALLSAIALWQPWNRVKLYRKSLRQLLPALLVAVSVIVVWQVVVVVFDIQRFLLPAPSVILTTFAGIYPRLVGQGWVTFQNALWGFAIGCGAGILFGLLSARFSNFSKSLMPYMIAVNSIPIIAFAPITNVWFKVTQPGSKIAIVVLLTFFPAMINTVRGLTSAEGSALELMHSYAASQFEIFRKVRLPAALPFIFTALKISSTLSMIGAIVAEYFGGPTTGLGVNISSDAALIRYPIVWSEIIIASALGIAFYFVVSLVERLVMPWHVSFRQEANR